MKVYPKHLVAIIAAVIWYVTCFIIPNVEFYRDTHVFAHQFQNPNALAFLLNDLESDVVKFAFSVIIYLMLKDKVMKAIMYPICFDLGYEIVDQIYYNNGTDIKGLAVQQIAVIASIIWSYIKHIKPALMPKWLPKWI